MKHKYSICLLALLFLAVNAESFFIPLTVEELSVESDAIVTGTVAGIHPYVEDNVACSKITITVEENLWGDVGTSCDIRILGGTFGNMVFYCPDFPHFKVGEKALFFLSKDTRSSMYILPTGKYSVESIDAMSAEQNNALRSRINRVLQLRTK